MESYREAPSEIALPSEVTFETGPVWLVLDSGSDSELAVRRQDSVIKLRNWINEFTTGSVIPREIFLVYRALFSISFGTEIQSAHIVRGSTRTSGNLIHEGVTNGLLPGGIFLVFGGASMVRARLHVGTLESTSYYISSGTPECSSRNPLR